MPATTKSLSNVRVKSADKGEVSAVFSTLNVEDEDGDVTLPGAIKDGTEIVISAYGHASWEGKLPVGKGSLRETPTEVIMDGQFFMDTTQGRETFSIVKQLGPLQEWSYSLHNITAHLGELNGHEVRYLEGMDVKEVSPVLRGSGVNTRTLSVKQLSVEQRQEVQDGSWAIMRTHDTATSERAWKGLPAELGGITGLRFAHAWVDAKGDPEGRSSYRLPHHDEHGANVRACVAGIASLVSGKSGIPEQQQAAVYEHLAAHLRDADRTPMPFKSEGDDAAARAIIKTSHELAVVLADVQALNDRMEEVGASRAVRGKGYTNVQRELIEWLADELKRTTALLDTADDEALREFARFVQLTQGV